MLSGQLEDGFLREEGGFSGHLGLTRLPVIILPFYYLFCHMSCDEQKRFIHSTCLNFLVVLGATESIHLNLYSLTILELKMSQSLGDLFNFHGTSQLDKVRFRQCVHAVSHLMFSL